MSAQEFAKEVRKYVDELAKQDVEHVEELLKYEQDICDLLETIN